MLNRKILGCFTEIISGNMNVKGISGDISEGNENMLLETGGKAIFVKRWQNLGDLCSTLEKQNL